MEISRRATRPPSTYGAPATAALHNDVDCTPVAVEAAAAEIAAAPQGVVLSDALQQRLKELGLAPGASSAAATDDAGSKTAAAAAASIVSAAVMHYVLTPGGMVSALQVARAKRAAAAAIRALQSGGASASGGTGASS